MIESLYIGATGMQTQQTNVDVIANNLANVNTTAFKKNRVDFEDLMYRTVVSKNGLIGSSNGVHSIGVGSAVSNTSKVFTLGEMKTTENQLDVAIQGQGFFEVILPDGSFGYTRAGTFQINAKGVITTLDGYELNPLIQVPRDTSDILIKNNGEVLVTLPGDSVPVEIGNIELANFINSAGLTSLGDNVYIPALDSGQVFYGAPLEDGFGGLAQGVIETSNVELIEELLNLIIAQRAYEINSRVVQVSDELLSMANNMRR